MGKAINALKRLLALSNRWEYTWLCVMVLATMALHFSVILMPDKPVYDEQFYVADSRSILAGHGTLRPEHPSLGKDFIVAGIRLFGDGPMGWRFFSVIFGTAGIVLLYLICRQLATSRLAAYLATFLFAFENMSFVQASIGMLDVYCVTLMLASFWLYLKGRYPLAGIMVGLSALAKLNGALAVIPIGLHWLLTRRDRPVHVHSIDGAFRRRISWTDAALRLYPIWQICKPHRADKGHAEPHQQSNVRHCKQS